jgi:hypothetical protein
MKRIIAILAGGFVLQGCLPLGVIGAYERDMEFKRHRGVMKMQDGLRQFNEGYRMVITGVEMNNLVAVQQGLQDKMAPGNKVIRDGRNKMDEGGELYYKGQKVWLDNKREPPLRSGPGARVGTNLMREGFKIAYGDGMRLLKQGVDMNNLVAQQEGATGKFSQNNQVIQNGMQIMEGGAKLFMQGEKRYISTHYFD